MKQLYYTEEGMPYIIRSCSRYEQIENYAGGSMIPFIYINRDHTGYTEEQASPAIRINTSNKIIPVLYSLGIYQETPQAYSTNFRTPFFTCETGLGAGAAFTTDLFSSLNKIGGIAEREYVTDEQNFSWNLKYTQAVLSASDFIEPSNGVQFAAVQNIAPALTGFNQLLGVNADTLVVVGASFIYFELI
jgi:hypothetical protein